MTLGRFCYSPWIDVIAPLASLVSLPVQILCIRRRGRRQPDASPKHTLDMLLCVLFAGPLRRKVKHYFPNFTFAGEMDLR